MGGLLSTKNKRLDATSAAMMTVEPASAVSARVAYDQDKKYGWSEKTKDLWSKDKKDKKSSSKSGGGGGGGGGNAYTRMMGAVSDKTKAPAKKSSSLSAKSAPASMAAAPQSSEPYVDPYAAKMTSALDRRFDLLRTKAEGQATAQAQQAEEASRREMASRGRIGSGAAQKQLSLQQKDLAGQKADIVSDIESQREMGHAQLAEQEAARGFARSERLGSQEYGTSERLGSQEFQQREMDRQAKFKDRSMKQEARQFDKSMALEMQKFKLDKVVSEFNMDMATKMWNKKDIMEAFANMWGYDPRTGGDSNTGLGKIMGEGGLGAPSPW